MDMEHVLELTSATTVAQMLERADFAERMAEQRSISVLEFLYPLLQGYDSVAVEADVELGGSDQLWNLLMGRAVQQRYGMRPQVAILERAERDERDAQEAREHYRVSGLPEVLPDATVAAHLQPGEELVAVRASVSADRDGRGDDEQLLAGPLYLTNRRLLLLARLPLAIDLSLIDEVALAGERLLLLLRDGTGLNVQTPAPRLLRVQISAAQMGARAS